MTVLEAAPDVDITAAPAGGISRLAAWGAVAILALLLAMSLVDRQVISVLIGEIRHDLRLGDFAVSVVTSLGFGIFYVLFSFPIGWLSDRLPRQPLMFAGVMVWSLATMAGGIASNFSALFLSRSAVGAGEAVILPSAVKVIGDSFPRGRVAFPFSVFTLAYAFGQSAALMGGGPLLDWAIGQKHLSVPLLGQIHPWQTVLLIVGAPGLVLAFLAFLLPGGRRTAGPKARDAAQDARFSAFMKTRGTLMTCHIAAFALTSLTLIMMAFWTPQYMIRAFHWSNTRLGLTLGLITLGAAIVGSLITGWLADLLCRRGVEDAPMRLFRYMLMAAFPLAGIAYLTPSAPVFLVCYFLLICLVAANHLSNTTIQLVTPPDLRGRYVGVWNTVSGLANALVGPMLVGFLTQYVFRSDAKLGWSVTLVLIVCIGAAIGLLTVAMPAMRRAVALLEAESGAG